MKLVLLTNGNSFYSSVHDDVLKVISLWCLDMQARHRQKSEHWLSKHHKKRYQVKVSQGLRGVYLKCLLINFGWSQWFIALKLCDVRDKHVYLWVITCFLLKALSSFPRKMFHKRLKYYFTKALKLHSAAFTSQLLQIKFQASIFN